MLQAIKPTIGIQKANDLRTRLDVRGDPAVAAEWEIAVVWCLARQGRIESIPAREGVAELEVIYTCSSGRRVGIEVTAVSDRSYHDRNPVRAFRSELLRVTFKHGIQKLGALHYQIGSKDEARGPVLGVPPRGSITTFFTSTHFRAFIATIRSAPTVPRTLSFEIKSVKSHLSFVPGTRFGGGSHTVFTLPIDARENPIASRLKSKDAQVARSGLELPCVVFLCDADCDLLSRDRVTAGGAIGAHEIMDLFLNGRRPGLFPGARSRSRRINGVVACRIKEEGLRSRGEQLVRRAVGDVVRNRSETHHELAESDLQEIGDCIHEMPPIARSPVNARTEFRRPAHFGGYRFTGGGLRPMKIELSLLTLQQLLAGTLSTEEFARDHPHVISHFRRATDSGHMISAVNIKPCTDEDDDWVEIELDAVAPSHLFKNE
jgi:hypothetical protein